MIQPYRDVEPRAERRHGCRQQGKGEPAPVRSRRHPELSSVAAKRSAIEIALTDHGFVPLSIASRLARNSLSGFHSG